MTPTPQQIIELAREAGELVTDCGCTRPYAHDQCTEAIGCKVKRKFERKNTAPQLQPAKQPLTEREIELIDGMIEVQLDHAERCNNIANQRMASKQKEWDMERVALLRKLKAAHGITGSKA